MAEDASLRDGLVTDPPAGDPPTPTTPPDPPVTVDTAAEKLGQLLMASGVTEANLNDVLAAPQALAAIRNALKNDPEEFVKMVERSDPETANKLLESVSDIWLKRNAIDDPDKPGQVKKIDPLMAEVKALREEVTASRTEQQRRDQSVALAATRARYEARVDDMFGALKEVKELNLTKAESKALRAQLSDVLGKDMAAVQRISNGNFVDVPTTFKSIVDEWSNDRKNAIKEAGEARERSKRNMFGDFQSGPNFQPIDIPANTFDSWDATEDGFAKALDAVSR